MAPFATSLWKNQLITPAKRDQWHAELPVSTDLGDGCSALKCSTTHAILPGASLGTLLALDLRSPGHKYGMHAPTLAAGSGGRRIADIDVSPFRDGSVAVSSDSGEIKVSNVNWDDLSINASSVLNSSPVPAAMVHFHPLASDLLLGVSATRLSIWDLSKQAAALTLPAPAKGFWSAGWSSDGQLLASTTKNLTTQIWDARSNPNTPSQEATGHQGIKASRVAWVNDQYLVSTGFSKMRERECCVYDTRNFVKPVKTVKLDSNSGVLWPLVDQSRALVYLAGRGDMSVRWLEVNSSLTTIEGAAALPSPILGCSLTSPSLLNPMKTEINRLIVSSKEGLVFDAPVHVPRRQTLDFHPELFPPVPNTVPALAGSAWLEGAQALLSLVQIGPQGPQYASSSSASVSAPATTGSAEQQVSASAREKPEHAISRPDESVEKPAETQSQKAVQHDIVRPGASQSSDTIKSAAPSKSTRSEPVLSSAPSKPAPTNSPIPSASAPAPASTGTPKSTTSGAAPSAHWSRSFLIGKTPLKPAYEGLSGLSTTAPPEQPMLRCNPRFLVFPLGGAGGRLAVHPTRQTGRLPSVMPGLVCGATITSFELDPFDHTRVYVACDDAKIRLFGMPEEGLKEDTGGHERLLQDAGMDRITQIRCHPTTQNLLLSVSDDRGNPTLRFWNLSTGQMELSKSVEGIGIFDACWSPDGSRLLLACKDRKLRVLDPRSSDAPVEGPSHDSPRPVHPLWVSDRHVLTTGFAKTGREIQLYEVTLNEVRRVVKQSLEMSPAPLFPHFDKDTSILFLHSKGERIASAYEVALDQDPSKFVKLPPFEHGTLQLSMDYLPKKYCDPSKVEVGVAYRLTEHTVERVSFCIPRARAEYFQDDVFPPTPDVEQSVQSVEDWLSGANKQQPLLDLNTNKMPLLSQAPPTQAAVSTRDKIAAGPRKTDDERAKEEMNHLWNKAQQDGAESDSDDDIPASGRVPEDDDW